MGGSLGAQATIRRLIAFRRPGPRRGLPSSLDEGRPQSGVESLQELPGLLREAVAFSGPRDGGQLAAAGIVEDKAGCQWWRGGIRRHTPGPIEQIHPAIAGGVLAPRPLRRGRPEDVQSGLAQSSGPETARGTGLGCQEGDRIGAFDARGGMASPGSTWGGGRSSRRDRRGAFRRFRDPERVVEGDISTGFLVPKRRRCDAPVPLRQSPSSSILWADEEARPFREEPGR